MVKKVLVSITAAATAFSMLVAPSITAFAEDTTSPVYVYQQEGVIQDGNVTVTGESTAVIVTEGSLTIIGDVSGESGGAIGLYEGNITVNGDVSSTSSAVSARNVSDAYIHGDITGSLSANDRSDIVVTGKVESNATGAYAYGGSMIVVDNGVTAAHFGVAAENNSGISVTGDVTSDGSGIQAKSGSTVHVDGDVNSGANGIWTDYTKDTVIVTGNVDSEYSGIQVMDTESTSLSTDDAPNIVVYSISSDFAVSVYTPQIEDSELKQRLQDAVYDSLEFIIKKDENVTLDAGYKSRGEFDLKTMTVNDILCVTAAEGMIVSDAGESMLVTDNQDGTFSIRFKDPQNPKGGIYIKATIKPAPSGSSSSSNSSSSGNYELVVEEATVENTVTGNNTPAPAANIPAEAVTVVSASAEAPAQALRVEGAVAPARSVSVNMTKLTPAQYREVVVQNVAATPAGTTLRLETDRVSVFDRTIIEAIASNPTIDVEVLFTYNGQKLRVVIPAGYDVRTLLDSNGYCGFLRLAALLGSQTVG